MSVGGSRGEDSSSVSPGTSGAPGPGRQGTGVGGGVQTGLGRVEQWWRVGVTVEESLWEGRMGEVHPGMGP